MIEKLIQLKCDRDKRLKEFLNFYVPIELLNTIPYKVEWWDRFNKN